MHIIKRRLNVASISLCNQAKPQVECLSLSDVYGLVMKFHELDILSLSWIVRLQAVAKTFPHFLSQIKRNKKSKILMIHILKAANRMHRNAVPCWIESDFQKLIRDFLRRGRSHSEKVKRCRSRSIGTGIFLHSICIASQKFRNRLKCCWWCAPGKAEF